jgi:diguanylate cyclase (GGDEF)-like protein
LTGLFNRRYIINAFQSVEDLNPFFDEAVAKRPKMSAMMMIDVDHFKRINDTYGHDIGDKVLIDIANVLKSHCRPQDIVGRFGGEEFILLMQGADIERAERKAVALLEAIRRYALRIGGTTLQCTASIGIAEWRPGEDDDFNRIMRHADEALYEAKRGGRDRVCRAIAAQAAANE